MTVPDPEVSAVRAKDALDTGADFDSRTLYLVGKVDAEIAQKLLVSLRIMDESPGDITVVMNSVGGLESDGYAIYDALMLARSSIVIETYGACESIAAIIMQAGDRRLMSPESQFMVHHGSISLDGETAQDHVVELARRIKAENRRYHRILAKGSGLPLKTIEDYCIAETYFDAKDAVMLGFADAVIGRRKRK